jgi:hypothetical protein
MSTSKLFTILGGLLLAIPIMVLVFFYIWFQTQFVQLGSWEDTELREKYWVVGQRLNRCELDVVQIQLLTAYVHPRYIWERVPKVWPRGEHASEVFKPDGTTYHAGGMVKNTARVYIKKKDGGPVMDVAVQNSLGVTIPDGVCQVFK